MKAAPFCYTLGSIPFILRYSILLFLNLESERTPKLVATFTMDSYPRKELVLYPDSSLDYEPRFCPIRGFSLPFFSVSVLEALSSADLASSSLTDLPDSGSSSVTPDPESVLGLSALTDSSSEGTTDSTDESSSGSATEARTSSVLALESVTTGILPL